MRIVIVDDEPSFAEIGELILSRAGFVVIRFESARDALENLSQLKPDMVISDVEMPGMDGFDFLRAIRENPQTKNLPFIMMSARRTYPPDRVRGLDLGSDDYVTKPFSGDELVSRVKAVLRRAGRDLGPEPEAATETFAAKTEAPLAMPFEETARQEVPAPSLPAAGAAMDPLPIFADLRRRLAEGRPAAVILANLSFFRGYNERYGYDQGDRVLYFVRQCLDAANHLVAGGRDTVSHLSGDEFLVLTEPDRAVSLARSALATFANGLPGLYAQEDRDRGFIEVKNRLGRAVASPFLNLTLAVAANARRRLAHVGQVLQIARELQAHAKSLGGSRYVEDRRRDPTPAA